MRPEAKVGVFVLAALLSLFALSTRVASVASIGKDGYKVYATVQNAFGLETNSVVRVQGVAVGYLKEMTIQKNNVLLTLFIYEGHKIADDSTIIIAQESLLGGNSINIIYGGSERMLADGDWIKSVKKYASIEEAVDRINDFAARLNLIFDDETGGDLKQAIKDLKNMGRELAAAGAEFRIAGKTINEKLPKIMAQIDDLTAEFKQTGADINAKLPEILDKFSSIEDDIKNLMRTDGNGTLDDTLNSVQSFFDKGSDTLVTLDNLLGKMEKAELQIDMGYNRMTSDSFGESHILVAYLPNPTNYYMIGVDYAPKIDTLDASGKAVVPGLHDDDQDYFVSAQLGKRYGDLLLRAGLLRGTGGAGVDYFTLSDRLKLTLEAYDFNAIHDIRGDKAHLRASLRFQPWKFITLTGGYDNFLNSGADNFFVGAGVHFVDDDLKYLLLSSGAGSMVK
ncbi:MAG: MlaD family protein [Helicobacteraceae bacterium]|jgi:phospholipid/cholesterol/gamma-HCH transport system substrate-binding protein|nr:MlaD family protein [Helicobacteraceae bacterium]